MFIGWCVDCLFENGEVGGGGGGMEREKVNDEEQVSKMENLCYEGYDGA